MRHACLRAPCVAWPLFSPTFALSLFLRLLLLTHFGGSPVCENLFPPLFWHNWKIYEKKTFFFRKKNKNTIFFLHISSSYAKILGETNFQPRELPRSGSKAKDGEKREREKKEERMMVITTASYALQTPPRVVNAKPPGPTQL